MESRIRGERDGINSEKKRRNAHPHQRNRSKFFPSAHGVEGAADFAISRRWTMKKSFRIFRGCGFFNEKKETFAEWKANRMRSEIGLLGILSNLRFDGDGENSVYWPKTFIIDRCMDEKFISFHLNDGF